MEDIIKSIFIGVVVGFMFICGIFVGTSIVSYGVDEPIIIKMVSYDNKTGIYQYKTNSFNFNSKVKYNVNDTIHIRNKKYIDSININKPNSILDNEKL